MEEKMLFLGYKAVILSSPFLGVSSFSLTLQEDEDEEISLPGRKGLVRPG
ncbi:hypothetical protein Q9233_016141 [Columba guinea]|nr:hypothetical protein Q9233_016141 [Columba guinea]